MSTQKTITIHLDEDDYERLEAEARRKGMQPDVLVESYVHGALPGNEDDAEHRRQQMLGALEEFDRLAATMPPFDAEKLVREGREELERRSMF